MDNSSYYQQQPPNQQQQQQQQQQMVGAHQSDPTASVAQPMHSRLPSDHAINVSHQRSSSMAYNSQQQAQHHQQSLQQAYLEPSSINAAGGGIVSANDQAVLSGQGQILHSNAALPMQATQTGVHYSPQSYTNIPQPSSGRERGVGGHHSRSHHRSAMMHQHRTSAAAISDPMAGTSSQLMDYSSGLNSYTASQYPYTSSQTQVYQSNKLVDPMSMAQASSGRYDRSYSRKSRHHSQPPVGSYDYDLRLAEQQIGDPLFQQSLGNLPSATSRALDARYVTDATLPSTSAIPSVYRAASDPRYYDGSQATGVVQVDNPRLNPGFNSLAMEDPLMQQNQAVIGAHHSIVTHGLGAEAYTTSLPTSRDAAIAELRARLAEAHNNYATVKRELDTTTQKLGSSMHSIKTFWSPELKKERAMRKEEATKYALINDQMKIMRIENQKQSILIRQLEDELRIAHELRMQSTDPDIQQHIDALCHEKEAMFKENCMLRDRIRELEMRVETQKQTLAARDDSIKKMVEMMNNRGIATKLMEEERHEKDKIKTRNIELETRLRHYESIIEAKEKDLIKMEELRGEMSKREQEFLTMSAKIKAYEDQQQNSERHIRLLKQSLVDKEEHYNLLLADVEELRRNLDERNRLIEKKSFQQTIGLMSGSRVGQAFVGSEFEELHAIIELKDKKLKELKCKVLNLNHMLAEREAKLDRMKLKLEHSTVAGGGNKVDFNLLSHFEESLSDKEKQISLLRDQKERYEHELYEERDSHERSIAEYNMKLKTIKSEMEKLQLRLSRANKECGNEKDSKYEFSSLKYSNNDFGEQPSVIKKLEAEKRSLQSEVDRLNDRLERLQSNHRQGGPSELSLASRGNFSAAGEYSIVEFERLQESLENQRQELRRAQAESRMNDMERKRTQEELDKLSERFERCQSEMHKLKARMENCILERDQLIEECERQQSLISKSQIERDSALADSNKLKSENERLLSSLNKAQIQLEKVEAQLEKARFECKKLEEQFDDSSEEMRSLQQQRDRAQRELKSLEMELQASQLQCQRAQQEKDACRLEAEKLREKYTRLSAETERHSSAKELHSKEIGALKERIENLQLQVSEHQNNKSNLQMELQEQRAKVTRLQKQADSNEQGVRNEVRLLADKNERLSAEISNLNEECALKEKENKSLIDKLQRAQNELVKFEAKLEQSEMDKERLAIELEKAQQIASKAREDFAKRYEETQQLQELYTKTNSKLLKLTDIEDKLRIDYDKCQMDLEVLRDRYEKLQIESRKLQSERDRMQAEYDELTIQRGAAGDVALGGRGGRHAAPQLSKSSSVGGPGSQDEHIARMQAELERLRVKLEQYQRENNKLNLEKERLLLDSKAAVQQTEQQAQKALLKNKTNEERLAMELERTQAQLEKSQARFEQSNVELEKLVVEREKLQQQLLVLQQEAEKWQSQHSTSVEETQRAYGDELHRLAQELDTVREKYTQQRKELLACREQQQNYEIDNDILKRELESAEQRFEKLSQEDAKLKKDSERWAIEIEKMRDMLERKQQEAAKAQKDKTQLVQEVQALNQKLVQCQQQQASSESTSTALQQQQQQQQQSANSAKNDDIGKLKQMLIKSESELQKTMAENKRLQMEVERLKLQFDEAAEYVNKVENDKRAAQRETEQVIEQCRQLQLQQQQQQQKSHSSGERLDSTTTLELRRLQEVVAKSSQDMQKLLEDRNKLHDSNQELKASMEKANKSYEQTIQQYEAELQRIQQQQSSSVTTKRDQPQKQQQSDSEYKLKFEKAVEAIRAFQKTSEDMKREIVKLNDRNKALSAENQSLAESLRATQEAFSNLQRTSQSTAQNVSSAADQQQQINTQSNNNLQEQQKLRKQIGELVQACELMKQDLEKQCKETNKWQEENKKIKQMADKVQSESNGMIKAEREKMQAQLEKIVGEIEKREAEIIRLRKAQDNSNASLQQRQAELHKFQKQLEEREKALEAKQAELQQASGGSGSSDDKQIADCRARVKMLENENAKLRSELERARDDLKRMQGELERLLEILKNNEEEKFNLSQRIEQLQSKLKQVSTSGQQSQPRQQQPQQQASSNQQQQRPPQTRQQQEQSPQEQHQRVQQQPQQRNNQAQSGGGAAGFISGLFQSGGATQSKQQ